MNIFKRKIFAITTTRNRPTGYVCAQQAFDCNGVLSIFGTVKYDGGLVFISETANGLPRKTLPIRGEWQMTRLLTLLMTSEY